jgi:hypothetical protein
MRTCQGCGNEYAETAAYCPRCGLGAGELLPALTEPQTFGVRPRRARPDTDNADDHGEELLDARRRGRRGPLLWMAAAVVVGGIALGIWLSGSSNKQQPSSALASIAAEHGGGSLPVTVAPETTRPPSAGGLVSVAPALANAQGLTQVRTLLTAYFTAINDHNDYAGWAATLAPSPGRATRTQYEGYKSTQDSDVSINTLERNATGDLKVSVSFTSRQDPKLGSGHDCLKWSILYTLVPVNGSLRIDTVHSSTLNTLTC